MLVTVYSSQPFVVAASGNHPLLNNVAVLVPWLISYFSLHSTPLPPCDHACMSIMCATIDYIPKCYRQTKIGNPHSMSISLLPAWQL